MSSRYFSTWGNSDHNIRQNEKTISSCLQRFGQHWAIPAERVSEKVRKFEILFMGVDREKYLIFPMIISDPPSDRPALEGTSDLQQDVQDRQQHPMWILPEEDIHLPEG